MSDQMSDIDWLRELRTLEDRLNERFQSLDDRTHERVQSHESNGMQAIAGVFSRSTMQVNFMLGLLVAVLGGGLFTIYVASRAYLDESVTRARTELGTSVRTGLDDFKSNLKIQLGACLDQKVPDAELRGCLEKALR